MATLEDVETIAAGDGHLAVLAVARGDGSVQASVVSAGVIADPVDGALGVGLVAGGGTAKLALLRSNPRATVVFKHGYEWVAVAGSARLVGPDDPAPGFAVPPILRAIFVAAGGDHEDWAAFDRAMADERRCGVFVRADAVTSNG
jgi:Pyridoxamine 5'-phosphate oxidase